MPSAVYRPSTDTGSLPATHTLLSWQTSKEKLWLHVYTSCLSILLCFSKNLANQLAQRMLPSAKLLPSAGYMQNAWITMCRYVDDLWGKQTFQDTLESLFISKPYNSSRYMWRTSHFFPPDICSTQDKGLHKGMFNFKENASRFSHVLL